MVDMMNALFGKEMTDASRTYQFVRHAPPFCTKVNGTSLASHLDVRDVLEC